MRASAPVPRPGATLGVVFVTLFLDLVGFSIVFPLFAAKLHWYMEPGRDSGLLQWAMGLLGGEPAHQAAFFGGLLGALYAGIQFITAPIWGRVSDRIGRRPVLIAGLVGSFAAYAIWVVSANFTLFLISRLIAGFMSGNVSTANAAVSDITTSETRGKGMAVVGMSFGLGFVLGPAIGGLTAGLRIDDPTATAAIGLHPFSVPALIAASLALFNLLWAIAVFRETLPPERRRDAVSGARTANPLQMFNPQLGTAVPLINGTFMLHTLLFSGMESTLVFITTDELHLGPAAFGGLLAGMGIFSALIQGGIFRRLSGKFGIRRFALIGLLSLIPGFLLIGWVDWVPSVALLIGGLAFLGISSGLVFPALSTLVSLAGDQERQGWVLGTFRSSSALGRAIGPLLAGFVYYAWRPGGTYIVAAILVLVPVLLLARLRGYR